MIILKPNVTPDACGLIVIDIAMACVKPGRVDMTHIVVVLVLNPIWLFGINNGFGVEMCHCCCLDS